MEIFNTERFCLLRMNSFGFKQIRNRIRNISVSQWEILARLIDFQSAVWQRRKIIISTEAVE